MPQTDPPRKATAEETDNVTVRNNTRRGLMIRVPGRALHLQPGREAEVPRSYLNTEELAALVRTGAVLPVTPPPAASKAVALIPRPPEAEPAPAPTATPAPVADPSSAPARTPRTPR